ncbi:MAG: hypothetical protein H6713_25225 [Myxococcales bacterium]|nr:hypothetical protein [Myxococcales bacterium]MCB9753271.1 hypothetical protein [Myxococcales bacterium]
MGKYRVSLVIVGILLSGSYCDTTVDAIEDYLDARDDRVSAFCGCFGPLIGYTSEAGEYGSREVDACVEGEQYESPQRSCITAMYEADTEYPPDIAFDCLTSAESDYTSCLRSLSCDDLAGLEECIAEFNDTRDECPRMSSNDESTFERCTRV